MGRLMPTVEMIGVLCDWCGDASAIRVVAPPRPEVVRRWKLQYLEVYDEQIDGPLPSEGFAPERRAHILRTVDRPELLATDYWENDCETARWFGDDLGRDR